MGLFGTSNETFVEEVEKATNENSSDDDWSAIISICDKAGKSSEDAKGYFKAIVKRLAHHDPHIALHAITLLDACVKNSGKLFHIEIASREFENDYMKLMQKAHPDVSKKLREVLKRWAENEFKSDGQLSLIPSLYNKLKNSGLDFCSSEMSVKKSAPVSKDPNVVDSQEEESQIIKAIELSLKESTSLSRPSTNTGSSLYPSTNLSLANTSSNSTPVKEPKKVRALYDFEAAEDNELTFKTGEIIFVTDDSDPNWWKGNNQRGEGLFPSNFVTQDLDIEPEKFLYEKAKKIVQFKETSDAKADKEPEDVEINEEKIDRLLHLLHEADPTNPDKDTEEMLKSEREVNGMGPLIDSELEVVDRKHAQLSQLSADLVDALGLYHTLMREPPFSQKLPFSYSQMVQQPSTPLPSHQHHHGAYNGLPMQPPPTSMIPALPPPGPHYGSLPPMMPPVGSSLPPGLGGYPMHPVMDNRLPHSYGTMVPPHFPPTVQTSQTLIHNGPPNMQGQHYMPGPNTNQK